MTDNESFDDYMHRVLKDYMSRPIDEAEQRTALREHLVRAIAGSDARKREADAGGPPLSVWEQAEARLLDAIRKLGAVGCWLFGPLIFARVRASRARAELAGAVRAASLAIEEAATLVATATLAVVTIGASFASPALAAVHARAHATRVISQSVGSASIVGSTGGRISTSSAATVVGVIAGEPKLPKPSAGASLGKDDRRIYVKRWVDTWIPGGSASNSGDGPWLSCEHDLHDTVCATYDMLPQGPWNQ